MIERTGGAGVARTPGPPEPAQGDDPARGPRLDSRFDTEVASPGFMLWRVTNQWQALMRRTLAPFDLTHVQFVLLAALAWAPSADGITQSDLSHAVRADPMMVSQVLRALEAKQLVRRRPDPGDRRARRISATREGTARASAANRAVEEADEGFFGAASARSLPLVEHLSRLDTRGS